MSDQEMMAMALVIIETLRHPPVTTTNTSIPTIIIYRLCALPVAQGPIDSVNVLKNLVCVCYYEFNDLV